MTLTNISSLVDLRFQEAKIKNGSMAIAQGFAAIHHQDLWRMHPSQYESFQDYCIGEWSSRWTYGYIQRLVAAFKRCEALEATVTSMTVDSDVIVAMPSSERQVRALQSVPLPQQAEAWIEAVEEVGGCADDVEVKDLVSVMSTVLEKHQADFPLGMWVRIESPDEDVAFNGYRGHVLGYKGTSAAEVRISLPGGGDVDMPIFLNWLKPLDLPLAPIIPKQSSKKKGHKELFNRAIDLITLALEEGMEAARDSMRLFLSEL